jgi:outer membrane receptor for ferrienterochelin and colicins
LPVTPFPLENKYLRVANVDRIANARAAGDPMNRAALRTGSASAARAPLVFAIVLAFAGAGAAARAQEPDAGVVPLEEGETEPEQTPEREPVEESAVEAEAETQTESTEEEPGAEDGEEDSEEPSSEEDDFANMSLEALLTYRVVSASLLEEDAWSAPAIISVVTQDDMREWGWLSVAELLQFQPGFYAINDFVNYNVGIRGVNGGMGAQSQVLRTMLDGRDLRFRPTGGSFFGPELVPRLAIRQVEIVRGPVSSLYGADAFLGAINIIPNRAADMGAGNARATVTTINQWNHWGMQGDAAVWADPGGVDSIITASVRSTDRGGLRLPESSPQYDSLTAGLGRNYIERDTELAVSALSRFELDWEEGSAVLDANVQFFERDANFNFESSPLSDGRTSMYTFGSTLRLNHTFERKVRLRTFAAYSRGGITDRERLVDRFIEAGIPYLRRTLNYQSLETRLELTYADELPFGPIPF